MVSFPVILDIYIREPSGELKFVERVSLTEPATYSVGRLPEKHIVLDAPQVSRNHALLIVDTTGLEIVDENSTYGTSIGEKKIVGRAHWTGVERIRIDPFEIAMVGQRATATNAAAQTPSEHSIEIDQHPRTDVRAATARERLEAQDNSFPASVFKTPVIDVGAIRASGYLRGEFEYLALGGGLGSFAWVDHLRIFGVPAKSICVLGNYDWNTDDPADYPKPYANYRRLCLNSQIPGFERLRSNSISTPDNIWGFPGYASRESWRELKRFRLGGLRYIMQVFGEPALAESFTPRSDDVFNSLDREAARIGWKGLCLNGRILALRKTNDGRYAVAVRMDEKYARGDNRDRVIVGKFVHLATGYPAYRTEKDAFDFNARHLNEHRAFKAYDPHDWVYQALEQARAPRVVAVRGRGIVASRILQRLNSARELNNQIQVVHQMRTAIADNGGSRYKKAKRAVFNNTELQPFNWPKGCWGGQLRASLENAPPERRSLIISKIGGTTTAARRDWKRIVQDGRRKGWYRTAIGKLEIKDISERGPSGKVLMEYTGPDQTQPRQLEVDFVIDCIGLIGDVTGSEFLKDLVQTYKLPRNLDYSQKEPAARGLAVTPDFEVAGLRHSGGGRVYAAGQITVHGPHAAVDSFLGLQYAALRSVDNLHEIRAPHVSGFGIFRSFRQWLRWCFNRAP
jgi:pSer/pThr/pTyr-binding forkhead associated (FHA) protein